MPNNCPKWRAGYLSPSLPPFPPPFSLSRDIEWRRVVEDGVNRPWLGESFPEIQSNLFYFSPELKAEIERLKQSHVEGNQQISARALAEVASLREKLKETQHLLAESTRWVSLCAQFFFLFFPSAFLFVCVTWIEDLWVCLVFFVPHSLLLFWSRFCYLEMLTICPGGEIYVRENGWKFF